MKPRGFALIALRRRRERRSPEQRIVEVSRMRSRSGGTRLRLAGTTSREVPSRRARSSSRCASAVRPVVDEHGGHHEMGVAVRGVVAHGLAQPQSARRRHPPARARSRD